MTRDEILDALCTAPAGQFDLVVAKLAVPAAYLSGSQAAQATRAAELLRYMEHHGRLAELERALRPGPLSTPGGATKKRRVMIATLGALLLLGAGAARWQTLRHPPVGIKLIWAPADCENKEPRVGHGSCNETRELPWLRAEINVLRSAGVQGFESLQPDPKLWPAPSGKNENWLLYLESHGRRFIVGVGYDRDTRGKDGCLHVYDLRDPTFQFAVACLDVNGRWWTSDGWLGTYRRIDPISQSRP